MATISIIKNIAHRLHCRCRSTVQPRLEGEHEDSPKPCSRRRNIPLPVAWRTRHHLPTAKTELNQKVVGGHVYRLAGSDSLLPFMHECHGSLLLRVLPCDEKIAAHALNQNHLKKVQICNLKISEFSIRNLSYWDFQQNGALGYSSHVQLHLHTTLRKATHVLKGTHLVKNKTLNQIHKI